MLDYFLNLVPEAELREQFKKCLLYSLLLHVVSAVLMTGFVGWDEHYQIYEFLGAKLGVTAYSDLAWEYPHRMRSWIQPGMYYLITKPLHIIGLENPFWLAGILRLISGLLAFIALSFFNIASQNWFKNKQVWLFSVIFSHFLWFIPYIHTRTSSEGVATTLLILALGMILTVKDRGWKRHFAIGVILGLSFQFRFQFGFIVAFLWFWQMLIKKESKKYLGIQALGISICFFNELITARWGYGVWTFPPYNYFYENVFLNKQANFGKSPWWGYLMIMMDKGTPLFGSLGLLILLFFWGTQRKHILTWVTLPLFLLHSYFDVKVIRFIFPVITFIPFMLAILWDKYDLEKLRSRYKFVDWGLKGIFGINVVLLLYVSSRTVEPLVDLQSYIYKNRDRFKEIQYLGANPFSPIGLKMSFYIPENVKMIESKTLNDLLKDKKTAYKVVDRVFFIKQAIQIGCKVRYSSFSPALINTDISKYFYKKKVWALLECP